MIETILCFMLVITSLTVIVINRKLINLRKKSNELLRASKEVVDWFWNRSDSFRERCNQKVFMYLILVINMFEENK